MDKPQTSYTPYNSRPQWNDVTPMKQEEAENALVPIMYTAEYADASSYFRAISASSEKSDRALELTEHIIRLNPAHYTVWAYRFQTIQALGKSLEQELELMNEFARENLKSYQVWHHRLLLLTHLPLPPSNPLQHFLTEIDFLHTSLIPDSKNYHTWAYLHWLFCHFSSLPTTSLPAGFPAEVWEKEAEWCAGMLDSGVVIGEKGEDGEGTERGDERNNSAWGWRWFLMVGRPAAGGNEEGEIRYAIQHIKKIPHNASAWTYLRGVHTHFSIPFSKCVPEILHLASAIFSVPVHPDTTLPVPLALEFLADACSQEGKFEEAAAIYDDLKVRDVMRKTYWAYLKQNCLKSARKAAKAGGAGGQAMTGVETSPQVVVA